MKKLVCIILCILLVGCSNQPIKIGFTAGLTGILADEAIATRNGYLLAIEEINEAGGINGRLIEPIVKDDESSNDTLYLVNQTFNEEDVHLIVGPFISSSEPEVRRAMTEFNHLFVSPSIATSNLSDEDDNFYRVIGDNHIMAKSLYDLVLKTDIKSVVIVQDTDNLALTEVLSEDLTKYLIGSNIDFLGSIDLSASTDLDEIVDAIKFANPDGVLFLAGSVNVAKLLQKMDLRDLNVNKYVSTWALSTELIKNAGLTSEGVYGVGFYDAYSNDSRILEFREAYLNRFNTQPASTSLLAYDAVYLLKQGLENADSENVEDVKAALDNISSSEGVTGQFELNEYGDAIRPYTHLIIIDGEIRAYE